MGTVHVAIYGADRLWDTDSPGPSVGDSDDLLDGLGLLEHNAEMGSSDLTDGTWLFPEGLVHYVRRHALKPPEDFLQHMRESGFLVPDLPEDEIGLVVE